MSHSSSRAVVVACVANGGIALAKIVGFLMTGAASMLAEAVHSLADTGNQALLLWGSKRGSRAPSDVHQFGYGPERYFWSFVVALVLFALGSVYAIYEGIERMLHPHELESPAIAMAILGVACALEGWSFKTALAEAKELRKGEGWLRFLRGTKEAELPVVLLEDTGALLGLVFALLGVTVAALTGDARFDAFGSIVIGLLLGAIAVMLAFKMHSLLIGESASDAVEEQIRAAIMTTSDVQRVIHMRTVHLAPDDVMLAVKLEMSSNISVPTLCARIDEAEKAVRAAVPIVRLIFIEPDIYRAEVSATAQAQA